VNTAWECTLANLVRVIVRQQSIDVYRRQARMRGGGQTSEEIEQALEQAPAREERPAHWERVELHDLLEWVFNRLRPHFQEPSYRILTMRLLEDRTFHEIADELSLSVSNVYTRWHRLLEAIRDELERAGLEEW
jgi:RNA polymerase sigma factor (sigma-70 family)